MFEMLYARLLPGEPSKRYRGMIPRQHVMIPDEHGIYRRWDSGDRNWTEVSPEHGEILKSFVLQPWRRGQICPFEVCTAEEVANKARHYEAQRAISRDVPGTKNARRFDGGGLAGKQGIPEPEAELVADPRDEKIAALEEQMSRMLALIEGQRSAPSPSAVAFDTVDALDDEPEGVEVATGPDEDGGLPGLDDAQSVAGAVADLVRVKGIGQKSASALAAAGIMSVGELAAASVEHVAGVLESIPGVNEKRCARWVRLAQNMVSPSKE